MNLSKDLQAKFAERGISVRWYPEREYADFQKRIWQKDYEWSYNYSKDNVRGSEATTKGYTNVLYESYEELEERCRFYADMWNKRHCNPYEFDMLYIEYDGKLIMQKIPVKSKEVTEEYVEKLIAKNEKLYSGAYGDFSLRMQKILNADGINYRMRIYPTTYGIGVWLLWNWNAEQDKKTVTDIMDKYGVDYENEYSDKGWVYRFKVSKKAENLKKIPASA